jgi:hypothetical protein
MVKPLNILNWMSVIQALKLQAFTFQALFFCFLGMPELYVTIQALRPEVHFIENCYTGAPQLIFFIASIHLV